MHSFDVKMNNFVLFDLKMLHSQPSSVQLNAWNSFSLILGSLKGHRYTVCRIQYTVLMLIKTRPDSHSGVRTCKVYAFPKFHQMLENCLHITCWSNDCWYQQKANLKSKSRNMKRLYIVQFKYAIKYSQLVVIKM